jgi:hypothetical protein
MTSPSEQTPVASCYGFVPVEKEENKGSDVKISSSYFWILAIATNWARGRAKVKIFLTLVREPTIAGRRLVEKACPVRGSKRRAKRAETFMVVLFLETSTRTTSAQMMPTMKATCMLKDLLHSSA